MAGWYNSTTGVPGQFNRWQVRHEVLCRQFRLWILMKNQFLTYYLAMLGQILMIPTKITLLLHYAESRCRQILAKKCFSFRPCSWRTILLPDIGVQNPSIKCLEFWQHPLNEEVPIRAVESESLKVGKSLKSGKKLDKIGKNRIRFFDRLFGKNAKMP